MKPSTKAIRFLESLSIPEGPKAGQKVNLAPFQKQFVKGVSLPSLPCWIVGRMTACQGGMSRCRTGGELDVLGDQTVPVAPWLVKVMQHVDGEAVAAITADRYKQAELGEAIDKAEIRCPIVVGGNYFT